MRAFIFPVLASILGATACAAPPSTERTDRAQQALDPASPTVCAHESEGVCLADQGCAWGNQGNGPECFHVGEVTTQSGNSSPAGDDSKSGGCSAAPGAPRSSVGVLMFGSVVCAAALRRRRRRTGTSSAR